MKITSNVTYILPFLILLIPSWFLAGLLSFWLYYIPAVRENYSFYYPIAVVFAAVNAGLFYLAFLKLAHKVKPIVFKIILIAFPIVVVIPFRPNGASLFLSIVLGLLLLWAYTLFNTRYMATLTDTSIQYKNLLGHVGEIPLTTLTKLEQKRNILSMVSRIGRLLDISKKTAVGFRDEHLDEYEINLFMKVMQHNNIFHRIVENSNKAGNLNVRQYTI